MKKSKIALISAVGLVLTFGLTTFSMFSVSSMGTAYADDLVTIDSSAEDSSAELAQQTTEPTAEPNIEPVTTVQETEVPNSVETLPTETPYQTVALPTATPTPEPTTDTPFATPATTQEPTVTSEVSSAPTVSSVPDSEANTETDYSNEPGTDGQGTVVRDTTNTGNDKYEEFYTITTKDGNVYYLVIDNATGANNVYFLDKVTENDLLGLTDSSGNKTTVEPTPTPAPTDAPVVATETTAPAPTRDTSSLLWLLVIVVLGGGAFYYFKIRPTKSGDKSNTTDALVQEPEDFVNHYEDDGSEVDEFDDIEHDKAVSKETVQVVENAEELKKLQKKEMTDAFVEDKIFGSRGVEEDTIEEEKNLEDKKIDGDSDETEDDETESIDFDDM